MSLLFLPQEILFLRLYLHLSLGESKSVDSDPKTPTTLKVITSKLSFKRLPPLKLPAIFPKEKTSTMRYND